MCCAEVYYNPLQTHRTSATGVSVSSLTTHPHIQGGSRGRVIILGGACIGHFLLRHPEAFICTKHFFPSLATCHVFPFLAFCYHHDQLLPRFHHRGYRHLLLDWFKISRRRGFYKLSSHPIIRRLISCSKCL